MKVFASDLDQTLIFSKKWCEFARARDLKVVEYLNGKEQSYISKEALSLLEKIHREFLFIPSTTRTLNQYNRITFPNIKAKYSIVSNGAVILNEGKIDEVWKESIEKLKLNYPSIDEVKSKLKGIENQKGFIELKTVEDGFLYMINEEAVFSRELIFEYERELKKDGWIISDQGRKVYFLPECIQKGKALNYLKENINVKYLVSAGDSNLDLSLKKESDLFFIPPHSKLYEGATDKLKGIDGVRQMLSEVYEALYSR